MDLGKFKSTYKQIISEKEVYPGIRDPIIDDNSVSDLNDLNLDMTALMVDIEKNLNMLNYDYKIVNNLKKLVADLKNDIKQNFSILNSINDKINK